MRITEKRYFEAIKEIPYGKQLPTATYMYRYSGKKLPKKLDTLIFVMRNRYSVRRRHNVIKFYMNEPIVSFLWYPKFLQDAHPILRESLNIKLLQDSEYLADYSDHDNPPILHRKELMVPDDFHPLFLQTWQTLTQFEEKAGLYKDTSVIGNKLGWEKLVSSKGMYYKGCNYFLTGVK